MLFLGISALFFRLYRITSNDLLFYDEGMYLGYNRAFLNLVANNPPQNLNDLWIIIGLMWKAALATPKALWFFLVNLRVFVSGAEGYYYARILSAACGIGTVVLTYYWAKQYFKSVNVGVLSAVILLLLPSHVFYSRLGMQESLSGLLFLLGLYCFLSIKNRPNLSAVLSALFLFLVFLTNYRMVVAPAFLLLMEAQEAWAGKRRFDYKKIVIFGVVYLCGFVILGILENGINLKVNAAWMLNQAGESMGYRQWYNFLSFPYYLFKLENVIFGVLFFLGCYVCWQKKEYGPLPLLIVLLQMFLFSFAAEKGARYLCAVLPFAAMTVAATVDDIYKRSVKMFVVILVLMLGWFYFSLSGIVFSSTAYERALQWIKSRDANAKIIATQPVVEKLFVSRELDITAMPKTLEETAMLVKDGYRYLLIDPQLYISWTQDTKRFSLSELDFIARLRTQAPLLAVVPHLNSAMLERFVLDHNQDLLISIRFLRNANNKGNIFIYDLGF